MAVSYIGFVALGVSPIGLMDMLSCIGMPMLTGCVAPKSFLLTLPFIAG